MPQQPGGAECGPELGAEHKVTVPKQRYRETPGESLAQCYASHSMGRCTEQRGRELQFLELLAAQIAKGDWILCDLGAGGRKL